MVPGQDDFVAGLRRERELRMKGYREQALKWFPAVCGRCGREFEGKRLRELTIHHKDHDHDNNPPDGSNWELLRVYCHDNEHERHAVADWSEGPTASGRQKTVSTFKPFEALQSLLKSRVRGDHTWLPTGPGRSPAVTDHIPSYGSLCLSRRW